jgi:hypothetical protein
MLSPLLNTPDLKRNYTEYTGEITPIRQPMIDLARAKDPFMRAGLSKSLKQAGRLRRR